MTREEALELLDISTTHDSFDNYCVVEHNYEEIINEIFNEHEAQLRVKDEKIATAKMRHKLEHDRYLVNEAIIKGKDEEIIKLYNKFGEANEESVYAGYGIGIKKARSIVAMLFWEWKQSCKWAGKNHFSTKGNKDAFKKAYKMLKDNQ